MTASTSLSKLYGYLKGYEVSCYTGTNKSKVSASVRMLLCDEFKLHFQELDVTQNRAFNEVLAACDKYLTAFYCRMKKLEKPLIVQQVADRAKSDSKDLSRFMSELIQGANRPLGCLGIAPLNGSRECNGNFVDICDKCPYYLKSRFCVLYQNLPDADEDNPVILDVFEFALPETRYLALAMLKLTHLLIHELGISINALDEYYMLYNHLLTCSKVFELMNPSGEAREKQIKETLGLLTCEPLDQNSDKYQKYLKLLYSVFNDIEEGTKPYIQDIRNALDENKDFLKSSYDQTNDPYYSCKGTGQSRYTGERCSIVSSCLEIDLYKDLFKEFDEYVGYKSYYKPMTADLDITNDKIYGIRTILINNPGKFKGRIIHIFDNPLQDRCNYLQRRTKALLKSMKCDATKDHDIGRDFLRNLTLEWSLLPKEDRKGIYCFDFSNATDTLDAHFQWEVLNFVFGPEVANFWDTVSHLPKYIKHVDGTWERYLQTCGQPQGGLSSFNDFALAHHFIFLMDMKEMGWENCSPLKFYKIVGDDSACSSLVKETEIYNPADAELDKEGIPRSELEILHMDICKSFAGFDVNYSKSESAHWCDDEARLEFAKVTFKNGKFFSPVPFRLAMKYSQSYEDQLAVAIWRGARKEDLCRPFMDVILSKINNFTITSIVKCGQIEYLKPFYDSSIAYNASWIGRLNFCQALSVLNMGLACFMIQDHERDWLTIDTTDRAIKDLLSGKQQNMLNTIPANHKVWNLVIRNSDVYDSLKAIFSLEEWDDQMIDLLLSPLVRNIVTSEFANELIQLADTAHLLKLAKDAKSSGKEFDVSTIFPEYDIRHLEKLGRFANSFTTRGLAKKPNEEVVMFQYTQSLLKSLDDVLGYVHPVQGEIHELIS